MIQAELEMYASRSVSTPLGWHRAAIVASPRSRRRPPTNAAASEDANVECSPQTAWFPTRRACIMRQLKSAHDDVDMIQTHIEMIRSSRRDARVLVMTHL